MPSPITHDDSRRIRSTTAFVVETLILLIVLAASIGIFTQLFSRAAAASDQSARLCQAVNVAEDAAEELSADPAGVAAGIKVGDGVAGTRTSPCPIRRARSIPSTHPVMLAR